jgi:trehalose utilization protein
MSFLAVIACLTSVLSGIAAPIRVLVWDERQPAQKEAYTNFLGNEIAAYLRRQPGLVVTTSCLDDPEQGIGKAMLDDCDVLVWWGHLRNGDVSSQTGREIVERIMTGKLSLIVLHSAHWSAPFVEAMRERAREDALRRLPPFERTGAIFVESNLYSNFRTQPKYTDRLTPDAFYAKPQGGPVEIHLTLPNSCFPAYREDGQPSYVHVLLPDHPIVRGVPREFVIDQTEMYNEPFHVPEPDAVILEERWKTGEWFRSGSLWNIGRGKVFYFRPGHEVYPIYKNENVLRIAANAVKWLGDSQHSVKP